MKKHYFILTSFMLLLCTTIMAQYATKNSVPRPQAPGVEFRSANTPVKVKRSVKNTKKVSIKTAERVSSAPIAGDVAGYAPYDTLLLAKYTTTVDGNVVGSGSYTYDEYGHRKLVTTSYNGNNHQERYTYTIGQWNYWTSRLIEKNDYNGEWYFSSKEEREIDANKRLAVRKTYKEWDGKVYLYHEEHFNYDHYYTDEYGHTDYGCRIKEIYYNSDGSISSCEEYAWFQPAGNYILKSSQTDYFKRESVFGSDNVTYKIYSLSDNGTASLEQEEIHYFGTKSGALEKYYSNGEISYCSGEYYEMLKNTPEKNYTTLTYYQYSEYLQQWTPVNRTITSGMKYDKYNGWEEQFNVNYSIRSEYYSDGEWCYDNSETGEWLANNIQKVTYSYGNTTNESVSYTKYDTQGEYVGSVIYNADGSYILEQYAIYDDAANAVETNYIYYSALGEEQKTIVSRQEKVNNNEADKVNVFYLKEGDKLTPLTNYELSAVYFGQTIITKYTYTKEGMPLSIIYYIADDAQTGGTLALYRKSAYEYTAAGYKKTEYEYYYRNSVNETPIEKISTLSEYLLLDNGTYQFTEYEYDEDGTVSYANRTEETKELVRIMYSYNIDTKMFEVQYKECLPIETVASDGTITQIYRDFDNDGNVVNVSKNEELRTQGENMSAYYSWDAENKKWVGERKDYYKEHNSVFAYSTPAIPTTMYDDEYLQKGDESSESFNRVYSTYISYEWDNATDSWKIDRGELYDFDIKDNVLVRTETRLGREETQTIKYTIVGNKANGLIERREEVRTLVNNELNETETSSIVYTYKYNINNILSEETLETIDVYGTKRTSRTVYEYENCKVHPTNITEYTADETMLTISGLTISASDDTFITLYDNNGAKVAEAHGALSAPETGMYIVKCNGKVIKVILK